MGRRRIALVLLVSGLVLVPGVVWASHQFTDVPDGHLFHDDIAWLADNEVTLGCNPPENDRFCPDEGVTRGQMSAFMRRLSEGRVVDAGTVAGRSGNQIGVASASNSVQNVGFPGGTARRLTSVETEAPAAGMLKITGHISVDNAGVGVLWTELDTQECDINRPLPAASVTEWSPPVPPNGDSVASTWLTPVRRGNRTVHLCAYGIDPEDALVVMEGGVTVTWMPHSLSPGTATTTDDISISDLVDLLTGRAGGER